MRRLSPRVNVIPVIGKADSLTPGELKGFKKRVGSLAIVSGLLLATDEHLDNGGYRTLRHPGL